MNARALKGTIAPFASEIVQVTPELAAQWLEAAGPNRPVHQATVERLAADMCEGAWHLNGDRIRFDETGALRDGRHRLSAVIASRKTVPMEIVRGISEDAVRTVDTGRSRSFADALFIDNVPNARALAATAKWIWRYDAGALKGSPRQPSHRELRDVIARHPGIQDALRDVQRSSEFQPQSAIAFVYTLAKEHMPRKASQWLEALQEGENLTRSNPVWQLRRKLGSRRAITAPLRPIEVAALAVKSWNAFAANEELGSLSWSDTGRAAEEFPAIR